MRQSRNTTPPPHSISAQVPFCPVLTSGAYLQTQISWRAQVSNALGLRTPHAKMNDAKVMEELHETPVPVPAKRRGGRVYHWFKEFLFGGRHFCCCIPTRFGVVAGSLVQFLVAGALAIILWFEVSSESILLRCTRNPDLLNSRTRLHLLTTRPRRLYLCGHPRDTIIRRCHPRVGFPPVAVLAPN